MEDTWWVQKAQEIQNLADCNNTQGFYDAIKALYGPRKRAIAPVRSADSSTLLKDRQEILARWANHFESLLNHTNPVDPHILDNLPDLQLIMSLDTPSSGENHAQQAGRAHLGSCAFRNSVWFPED